jgi:hypothetical protein
MSNDQEKAEETKGSSPVGQTFGKEQDDESAVQHNRPARDSPCLEVDGIEQRSRERHSTHHDGNEQRGTEHLFAKTLGFAQDVSLR